MSMYFLKEFMVFVIISTAIHENYSKGGLKWTVSIVKLAKVSSEWRLTNIVDVTCTMVDCPKIYAKIRALHASESASSIGNVSHANTGVTPRALITLHNDLKDYLYIVDAFAVESDNCFCLKKSSYEWVSLSLPTANCLPGTTACERCFLAPINITHQTKSFHITIESIETSFYILQKSIMFKVINHNYRKKGIFNFDIVGRGLLLSSSTNVAKLKTMQDISPLVMMPVGNYVILSSNEMETRTVAKLSLARYFSELCNTWKTDVKQVLNLPDRFLIASKFGLVEYMLQDGVYLPPRIVLQRCITNVEMTSQSLVTNFHVMALSNDSMTFYIATYQKGLYLDMKIALDSMNRSICQSVNSSQLAGCRVLSFASSYTSNNSVHILVETTDQLLVEYSFNPRSFAIRQNFSNNKLWHMPNIEFSRRKTPHNFVEISFTQLYASYLFIWGNALLYSPNAGNTIIKMLDLKNDVIQLFETSQHGYFVFVTKRRMIYFGKIASLSLRRLPSLYADRILTMFFDSFRDLYLLLLVKTNCSLPTCIKKTRVLLRETIVIENANTKLINSHRCCSTFHREGCKENLLSCIFHPVQRKNIEQTCPFAKIRLQTYNYRRYSRTELILQRRNKWNSSYVSKLSEVKNIVFSKQAIGAKGKALNNFWWEDPSHDSDKLPRTISLERGTCYNFTIFAYLDHSDTADFYAHRFRFDSLQLSVTDPKPKNLIVGFKRTFHYQENFVKFQVHFCDSGKVRKKQSPGTGQEIISPEIKVIGSGLNCIANSYQDFQEIQGYFTTKVLLGCPAGLKVVFDSAATKKPQAKYKCKEDLPQAPCFHFDRIFSPVFKFVDEATLKRNVFPGDFTLKIKAGGRSLSSLKTFSKDEQFRYNLQAGSLIWAPSTPAVNKNVFYRSSSSFRWLCNSNSPCSGIAPTFPDPPFYYFVIEFSNRDTGTSNCDFTFEFTIRVEGISPGAINPSLVIVLCSIGLMSIGLIAGYFVRKRFSDIIIDIQWRAAFTRFLRLSKIGNAKRIHAVKTHNSEST